LEFALGQGDMGREQEGQVEQGGSQAAEAPLRADLGRRGGPRGSEPIYDL
ncbi:unnamed protein product, partial [marine sediment metagenome]